MRIATKLSAAALVPALMALGTGFGLFLSSRSIATLEERERTAYRIIDAMSEMNDLARSYMLRHEERPRRQFLLKHEETVRLIATVPFEDLRQRRLLENIADRAEAVKTIFLALASNQERRVEPGDATLLREAEGRLEVQLLVRSREAKTGASRLARLISDDLIARQKRLFALTLVFIAAAAASMTIVLIGLMRRIITSLAKLQEGARIVGDGSLGHRIGMSSDDEIGALARDFDRMSEKLLATTVSRDELGAEVVERRRAEEALRESEHRYATTLASIGDAVIATDAEGRITFMNTVAEDLTGWSLGDAATQPITRVFRIINEQTRDVVEDPVAKVLKLGLIVGLANHTLLVRKDGTEIPIDDSGAPIKSRSGETTGVVLVFRDILDRKRAEEALRESESKYRNLFENMAEEVHFWQSVRDEDGNIETWRLVDANPPTLKTWGRGSVDEIRGKTTDEIFGPGAREHYMPVVRKIMTEGVPCCFEDYFPHLDRYFRFTSVPLGEYFITTGADITEIKKVQEALKNSLSEKEFLLRELSHRTKNNMQVIGSLLSLQISSSADGKLANALEDTQGRIRAMALVHEKLYRSGNFASLNVKEYLADLVAAILQAHLADVEHVRVESDLDEISISIDAALTLGLVVNELVSNSLKHAFPDGKSGAIFLSLKGHGENMELKYRDDGPGLPPDFDLSRLGSLGLKLVQNLAVRQLRATMEIRRGPGAEFTFRFHPTPIKKYRKDPCSQPIA